MYLCFRRGRSAGSESSFPFVWIACESNKSFSEHASCGTLGHNASVIRGFWKTVGKPLMRKVCVRDCEKSSSLLLMALPSINSAVIRSKSRLSINHVENDSDLGFFHFFEEFFGGFTSLK